MSYYKKYKKRKSKWKRVNYDYDIYKFCITIIKTNKKFIKSSNNFFNSFYNKKNKWKRVNYDINDYKLFKPNDIGGYKSKYDFIDNATDEARFDEFVKIYGFESAKDIYELGFKNVEDFEGYKKADEKW